MYRRSVDQTSRNGRESHDKILNVSEEAVEAYEIAIGFVGIGRLFEENGTRTIKRRGASYQAQK